MAAAAPPHVHIGGPGLQPAIVSAVPRPKTKGRLLRHLLRERPGLLKRLLRRKRLRKAQRVVPVLPTVPGKPLRNEFRRGEDCMPTLRYNFPSNHNIHKSSCAPCFWAPDPLIDKF